MKKIKPDVSVCENYNIGFFNYEVVLKWRLKFIVSVPTITVGNEAPLFFRPDISGR